MNKNKLGQLEGKRVCLQPGAIYFRAGVQFEVTQPDIWVVQRQTQEGLWLENANNISFPLPHDHIHHFASELPRRGSNGTLLLTSQLRIDDWKVSLQPGIRPGGGD